MAEEFLGKEFTSDSPPLQILKYLPFLLGIIGIIFLILGIFLTLQKEKPAITISSSQEDKIETKTDEKIIIDVSGAVVNPGVYTVLSNARFQDGLIAAGGLSQDADRDWVAKRVNLAAKLIDGSKIYIPKVNENTNNNEKLINNNEGTGGVLGIASLVNINDTSLAELDTLPGVGAVTAQKIIDGRPYQKIEELTERKIVNLGVWEKIKEKISVY